MTGNQKGSESVFSERSFKGEQMRFSDGLGNILMKQLK